MELNMADNLGIPQFDRIIREMGRYYLLEEIGRGGMGYVYKAYDTKLERLVALKTLSPSLGNDTESFRRFQREAKSNARLQHPNIVTLYDFEQVNGSYFITMEYIEGCSLRALLHRERLTFSKSCRFVLQLLDAIGYAHNQGIIHRDIKPSNILVDKKGKTYLTDFGLAKALTETSQISQSGIVLGTPAYMAPEQAMGGEGEKVDTRCDIYSLGAVFYEMLTGVCTFDGGNTLQILGKVLYEEVKRPKEIDSKIPEILERVCLRALSKKKEDRFQTAYEMTKTINQWIVKKNTTQMFVYNMVSPQLLSDTEENPNHMEKNTGVKNLHPTKDVRVLFHQERAFKFASANVLSKKEAILQQLLLSLNLVTAAEMSECLSVQVDMHLQKTPQTLPEIIAERGYVSREHLNNLQYFKDQEGNSLIPHYEIINLLEEGITSCYLGRNLLTHETVTVKIFAPALSDTSSTIARFLREAEAAKKLDHPNIIKAIDFGIVYGVYYLVTEYANGISLSQMISKMGRMEEKKALLFLGQVVEALSYAWEQNIIHRDIRPDNIISDGNIVKIRDLGLAKVLESGLDITQEGNLVGTPQFMSPEQFQNDKELDYRSDIYSLGATFYMMLTGNLPFTAETKIGLAQAHLMRNPPSPERYGVYLSRSCKALLLKMMAKDREERSQEKKELLEDIHLVQQNKSPKNVKISFYPWYSLLWMGVALMAFFLVGFFLYYLLDVHRHRTKREISFLILQKRYNEASGKIYHSWLSDEEKQKFLQFIKEREALEKNVPPKKNRVPPVLVLTQPPGVVPFEVKQFPKKQIVLKGYATDDQKVASITVNGQAVPILEDGEKMYFETIFSLKDGPQQIEIKAKDEWENESSFSFHAYLPIRGWFGEEMPSGIERAKEVGEYHWKKDGSVMVYVPEGEFWYGESKTDMKKVYMRAYYIDKFEMTWKHYLNFCNHTGYAFPPKPRWGTNELHPITDVCYDDILACSQWIGKEIPTVAQWMKAARGGIDIPDWKTPKEFVSLVRNPNPFRSYPWGDLLPNASENKDKVYRCNYCADDSFVGQGADGYMYTARVGEFSAWNSPYGCADLAGNVYEICCDHYSADYTPREGETDPRGPLKSPEYRVKMGGGFYSLARKCMIGVVTKFNIYHGESQTGFRLIVPGK